MEIAKNKEGGIVKISEVNKGEIYYCLACGGEVLAKKGDVRQYFSHLIGKNDECDEKVKLIQHQMLSKSIIDKEDYTIKDLDNIFDNVYNDDVEDINGFTEEQLTIINSKEKRIKVDAKAGSGKTATCEEYIKVNSDKRILYLVFNKSMANEAKERFGNLSNVEIRTTYSMAYQAFGYQYKLKSSDINLFDYANCLNMKLYTKEDYKYISEIEGLFTLYLSSWYYDINSFVKGFNFRGVSDKMIKDLNIIFKVFKSGKYEISHGFYFKLWHLSKPDLSSYDVIIVDEFQDSQPALIDIIRNNNSVDTIMVVGDKHQNIYGFMNTINGLNILNEGWTEYFLTKSFRVGNTLATVISECMNKVVKDSFNMKGYNKLQHIVEEVDRDKPHFNICRYNATIIENAIKASLDGKKVYIEGGSAGVDFKYIKLMYDFWKYDKKHFTFKKYNDYHHMINTAIKINDINILQADKLIQAHRENLPFKLKSIEENIVKDWEMADICFTTAHKSKGMTITIPVVVENDFIDLNNISEAEYDKYEQEINILYVALSRCKSKVEIPNNVIYFYENGGE